MANQQATPFVKV